MTRKIVLVNYEFPPVQGPGIWRVLGFAKYLPSLGWDTTVVCSDRSAWHSRTESGLLQQLPGSVRIHRVRGLGVGDRLSRVLPDRIVQAIRRRVPDRLLPPVLKMAVVALRHSPPAPFVVLTSGPPHVTHLVGLVLKRMRRCIWVADFRDLWMDDPIMAGAWPHQRRLGLALERRVLHEADAVLTVSPAWQSVLAGRRGGRPTILLRNAADLDGRRLPAPERPWPASERVLLFAGTPQPGNATPALWEGVRRYLANPEPGAPRFRCAFLGLGEDTRKLATDLGISKAIDDLGPQSHDRALALLQGADGALIPVTTTGSLVSRGTIPAKLYEAIALGVPVLLLAEPDGDAAQLLGSYPHEFAHGNDANAVATAIGRFVRTPSSKTPSCPPPPSLAGWSRTAAASQLDGLLRELLPPESLRNPTRESAAASPPLW